ncbi:alanyl-tRNA editing protein [Crenobacter sp. SG2305]|uniref:alanyl-tRNA editing protein n=1 Tax=Crenobacter oryzisoli TaxID=3056844 RepID=UPI0025AA870C|nr:alanyl-tRNA editing protein [Crenobacter sp. SG2305]MDN0081511.1 alanyl-tRNA editing protein [Crenobacter sp. SG2305]
MPEKFYQNAYLTQLDTRVLRHDEAGLVLEDTIFYPLGGGQPGDTGTVSDAAGTVFEITDTRRDRMSREIVHLSAPDAPRFAPGTPVTLTLDWTRRYRHMRLHTALHLLSCVIRAGVTGGNLTAESARLDFDLGDEWVLDRDQIEQALNRLIIDDYPVSVEMTSGTVLAAQPELIKTMSVQPPLDLPEIRLIRIEGTDLQPCGGTHVAHTGEIGRVVVKKIENKGSRNKRVVIALAD